MTNAPATPASAHEAFDSSAGDAMQRDAANAVIRRFVAGFDAADASAVAATFAPDAVFLGTSMASPTTDPAGILAYFQAAFARDLPKRLEIENAEWLAPAPGVFLVSGQNIFHRTERGAAASTPARFSFVLVRQAAGWRISHFHSSRRPGS